MTKQPDVSIIVLTYNTKDLTLQCLSSLEKTVWGTVTREIIVVDNASSDQTLVSVKKQFPSVTIFRSPANIGFAAGNNVGIKRAKGRYILLLNSDTQCEKDSIPSMVGFMDSHPSAGAATCKLVLPDGSIDPACHRGFPTPWNACSYYAKFEYLFPHTKLFGGYHQGYKDMSIPHEVDAISGAFFMVRSETLADVGGLDESFFMYAEDIDWAYRIKKSGWQIWFVPSVTVLHLKKQSGRAHTSKDVRRKSREYFLENNKRFYTKHYEKKYPSVVTFFVYLWYDIQLFMNATFH